MKKNIILITLLLFSLACWSKPVSPDKTKKVATNWYKSQTKYQSNIIFEKTISYKNKDLIRIYGFQEGFVITSADDLAKPILAYSNNTKIGEEIPYNMQSIIDIYSKEIQSTTHNDSKVKFRGFVEEWKQAEKGHFPKPKSMKAVAPLIKAYWHQNAPYNRKTPSDSGGKTLVGCVATAMSMIMQYHQHPKHGEGSHSYTWWSSINGDNTHEKLSADYFNATYDWSQMPLETSDIVTEVQKEQVSLLCSHAGISVNMGYGSDGSGAYSAAVPKALINFFRYDPQAKLKYKYHSSTNEEWINIIKQQHDLSLPVYYAGSGNNGGHAFICDGYDENNKLHFNWGWGGQYNGYYAISALNPGESTFNNTNQAIINIKPRATDLKLIDFESIYSEEETLSLDLDQHFISNLGNAITYSIMDKGNEEIASAVIAGNTLKVNRIKAGITSIKIKAETTEESNWLQLDVKFDFKSPLAGFTKMYKLSSNSCLECATSTSLENMKKFTFASYVKISGTSIHKLANKSSSAFNGWYTKILSNNKIKFQVVVPDKKQRKIYSQSALEENKWYHIACTYDGTKIAIFINGEKDSEKIFESDLDLVDDSSSNLKIGSGLVGYMDEVSIWNKALSKDEIYSLLHSYASSIETDNELVSYWKFDSNHGDDAIDEKGNNHGKFINHQETNWLNSNAPVTFIVDANTSITEYLLGDKNAKYIITKEPSTGTFQLLEENGGKFKYTAGPKNKADTLIYKVSKNGTTSSDIKSVIHTVSGEGIEDEILLKQDHLKGNYPNPFNPSTTIDFYLATASHINMQIYNYQGQLVDNILSKNLSAGNHSLKWDINNSRRTLTSGIYFIRMKTNNTVQYHKIMLIK